MIRLAYPQLPAWPPNWASVAGIATALVTGVIASLLPAARGDDTRVRPRPPCNGIMAGLPGHLQVVFCGEQGAQTLANDGVVIHEQN